MDCVCAIQRANGQDERCLPFERDMVVGAGGVVQLNVRKVFLLFCNLNVCLWGETPTQMHTRNMHIQQL